MVETNRGIKRLMASGEIVMVPRREEAINNGSVDVSLGRFIARFKPQFKGTQQARGHETLHTMGHYGEDVFNLEDLGTAGFLALDPHERVLAHTHEFIGSRLITLPELRAKSSTVRWGLTVSGGDGGWGDCGYISRWTLEIYNMNNCPISVPVGALIGQVVFHAVEAPEDGTVYGQSSAGSSYQTGTNIDDLIQAWHPRQMLPRSMKRLPFLAVCPADENGL